MDGDEQELGNLAVEIDAVRRQYFRSRDHLRLAVQELTGGPDTADQLLMIANERGLNELAERLADSARDLGFEKPYSVGKGEPLNRLLDLTEVATLADRELCQLVAAREHILIHRDPTHLKRVVHDGRDVILDIKGGKMRFMDDGSELPLRIEVVESKGLPEKSLEALRRERQKDREDDA